MTTVGLIGSSSDVTVSEDVGDIEFEVGVISGLFAYDIPVTIQTVAISATGLYVFHDSTSLRDLFCLQLNQIIILHCSISPLTREVKDISLTSALSMT